MIECVNDRWNRALNRGFEGKYVNQSSVKSPIGDFEGIYIQYDIPYWQGVSCD